MNTRQAAVIRVVFVGAGPRAVMLLERLFAHLGADGPALEITLIDPHPPGAGRVWRRDQSPLLKLNSMAQDVTVFTDDTCILEGPVAPGPSLIEWAGRWSAGDLPDLDIDDELVRAELVGLQGDSFPTRRLQSYYLDWFWRTTVASRPAGVTVRWHEGVVRGVHAQSVHDNGDAREVVLASGESLAADVIVYCVGHNGSEPAGATAALIAASTAHGLIYVPPDFTTDADLSGLTPGQDVIVRGLGLAAIDLVVLLAEGRGGRFHRDADGVLAYQPSGHEPRLHMGSTRGVPYRSKVSSVLQGEPFVLEVLTSDVIAALQQRAGRIDFDADVWPLVTRELTWAHYRELFTGHPDRVTGTWEQFRAVLRTSGGDPRALRREAARFVPDPLDRFDVPSLDRPLAGETFGDRDALQTRIRAHIRDDLELRTTPQRSSAHAVFLAVLFCFVGLTEIPPEKWSARSRIIALPAWQRFFSYVASGPPAHRLQELAALSRAGVVQFLGADLAVRVDPSRGFVASSPGVPGEVVAGALVDAWLPESGAAISDNAALRELAYAHGRELHVVDEVFSGSLGRIEVDPDGRVIAPDAAALADVFAIGSFTSSPETGAFTRPRSNALALRQTDRVAGALTARLRERSAVHRVVAKTASI